MPTCSAGHASVTDDYCDTCGVPIGAAPPTAAPPTAATPTAPPTPCPGCGDPVEGRFCESCGYDLEAGAPAATASASLTLSADRSHWDRMVGSGEPAFPAVSPTLTFELAGDRATLGRTSAGTADVDLALTGAATDAAVSHRQCQFVREGTSWTVCDLGSANGTWINDADAPLPADDTHTLVDGDRILIGAWTCLTVHLASTP